MNRLKMGSESMLGGGGAEWPKALDPHGGQTGWRHSEAQG